jgi:hypothetical protein
MCDIEAKELVIKFRIQHKMKQDALPEGLKQPWKPPMRGRLPTANFANELDPIEEDLYSPPEIPIFDDSGVDIAPDEPIFPSYNPTDVYASHFDYQVTSSGPLFQRSQEYTYTHSPSFWTYI